MTKPGIILASASPRRKELLAQIGIMPVEIINADIDEAPLLQESAADCVTRLAIQKACAIAASRPDAIVLAADTLIVCEGVIVGKPESREHAFAMWQMLSNRWHQVLSSVAVVHAGNVTSLLSSNEVSFAELSLASMCDYWATGEPADKAGAYAIQGQAAVWIREIRGSYSGIMGLPLYETALLLKQAGIKTLL